MTAPLCFAVIGSPVAHSKSPAMHAAAYRSLGMPHVYEKLETTDVEVAARVEALRRGDYAGLNVTVPHKTRVLDFVDEIDDSVRAMGAANTLVRTPEGRVRAFNTDAPALEAELAALAGGPSRFASRVGLVLGTGGAARAAERALTRLGVSRVVVRGRSARATEPLVAPAAEDPQLVAIVQATSCGMTGGPPGEIVSGAVAWESVPDDAVAIDVVYDPSTTPFVERAAARGLAHASGLGMLVRQGALAFSLWLGGEPPYEAMLDALLAG